MAKQQLMLTGNKGEWSEIFVLLKILADSKVSAADEKLNPHPNRHYRVVKVFRNEKEENLTYELTEKDIHIYLAQRLMQSIPRSRIQSTYTHLYTLITDSSTTTFSCRDIQDELDILRIKTLKCSPTTKGDICLEIYDPNTESNRLVDFSIKSQVGADSTLLNASAATNFRYMVFNLPEEKIEAINAINSNAKIRDRINAIYSNGATLDTPVPVSKVFASNIQLIDSVLKEILGEALLIYFSGKAGSVEAITKVLADKNPLMMPNPEIFYAHKFKDFLYAVALGLRPASEWNGTNEATGGYLILKSNGELVCFYIHDAESLKNYLFKNTRFESPGSTRHKYGVIYRENKLNFLNLNLQIRFN